MKLSTPHFAVIFTSQKSEGAEGYSEMSARMMELAKQQPGFIDVESSRDQSGLGITVSYWKSLEEIVAWKKNTEHLLAQKLGRDTWYSSYKVRICKVEREYSF
jgi:heme-degrading monooxygenase HmoA